MKTLKLFLVSGFLAIGMAIFLPSLARVAEAACRPTPAVESFTPTTTTVAEDAEANYTVDIKITCTKPDKPDAGYRVFLYKMNGTSRGDLIGSQIAMPTTYDVKPATATQDYYIYKISSKFKPFPKGDKGTTYSFRVYGYPPGNGSGSSSNEVKFTKGTTTPTNTPTNNPGPCTGTGCGTTTVGDFDRSVGSLINPINVDTFPELVLFVMKGFIFLIGVMAVLIIIIGGVRMVLSQGNQESITKGKQTVIWAVAGLIVALLSFSMVSIVQNLLGQ